MAGRGPPDTSGSRRPNNDSTIHGSKQTGDALRTTQIFYACAAIVLLLIAYSVGANRALGSAGNSLTAFVWHVGPADYAIDSAGVLYASPSACNPWTQVAHLPTGETPVGMQSGDAAYTVAIGCASGNFYVADVADPANVTVTFCSSVFGSVASQRSAWGDVKSAFRH